MDAEKRWILKRVALMTTISIAASVTLTITITYVVAGTLDGIVLGLTIATIAPGVIAPLGSYHFISMSSRLRLANDRLKVLSEIDSLTNTLNRRTFMEVAEKALALAARHRYPTSLLVLDFDRFKQVNDIHGHAAGDKVLVETVNVIRSAIRETDLLARIGGEEFILLLPHTARQGADYLAERILRLVRENEISTDTRPLSVTVSIGGVTCATSESRLDEMMSSADKLLYQAKQAGRDQFVMDEHTPPIPPVASLYRVS